MEVLSKLKLQSDNYSEANRALIRRKRELGYTSEVEELVKSRLKLVHCDAFELMGILNNRLRVFEEDACSSLHTSRSVAASIANDEQLEETRLCTQLGSNNHPGENLTLSKELGTYGGVKPVRHERDDPPAVLKPDIPAVVPNCH